VHGGALTAGALVSFLLYARLVADAISNTVTDYSKLAQGLGAIERVMELLREPTEPVGRQQPPADAPADTRVIVERRGAVEFRDVDFRYPHRDRPVLQRVSFAVEPGSTVALVGPSGVGKSTVAALIARLYDVDAGVVEVDGVDVRLQDLTDLRRSLAIVPQDVLLLAGTIAENIRLGKRDATRAEVARAAEVANAAEFIEAFPAGYATRVGERGQSLSGGQRQRLAIARAVLANPRLLILDEATNALDVHTESLVTDALERLMRGRTNLIIAHRLSTVLNADQVVVLQQGRVVEHGTPRALLQRDSRFAAMAAAQSLGLQEAPDQSE
jgi:ABC-type multidrug transport system fused ATPase/permease subunit